MVAQPRFYTVDELERIADSPENKGRLLELINGEIVEQVPTEKHGMYGGNIYGHLWTFVRVRRSGRVVMEVRHRVPNDQHNARIPDVSYIAGSRPAVEQGSVPQMPDLAVEIKSPDDTYKGMRERARYYLANGAKMVWLVYPEKRIVEVLTAEDEQLLTEADRLSSGTVLPGFEMSVRDVFEDTAE